jgi:hypothetical protein
LQAEWLGNLLQTRSPKNLKRRPTEYIFLLDETGSVYLLTQLERLLQLYW